MSYAEHLDSLLAIYIYFVYKYNLHANCATDEDHIATNDNPLIFMSL